MSDKIRVLIVDDLPNTRENVRKLLQFEVDVEVVGQAGTGDQAIELAKKHKPDIILMDINMPGTDGIRASREITQTIRSAQVIIMSVQSDADYLRRAMLAGARDFLMKPFSGEELITAIRRVYETRPMLREAAPQMTAAQTAAVAAQEREEEGHVIVVYSPKGGSGCTTVATNLAITMSELGHSTLLVDTSLQFGGVDVTLNMKTVTSIVDLVENIAELDSDLIGSICLTPNDTDLKVLLAPPRPEMAELVKSEAIVTMFAALRKHFEYIVVDTPSALSAVNLSVLDIADKILLVAQQNLPTLKNVSRFFNLTDELGYDREKVVMVVNRELVKASISVDRIGGILKRPILSTIPIDDESAITAGDKGKPLVIHQPALPISQALRNTAKEVIKMYSDEEDEMDEPTAESAAAPKKRRRFFGFGG